MAKKRRKKKGNSSSQPEELDEKSKNFIYLLVVIGMLSARRVHRTGSRQLICCDFAFVGFPHVELPEQVRAGDNPHNLPLPGHR